MAGKTPRQAAHLFLAPIQQALSCVTTTQLHMTGHAPGEKQAWTINGGKAVTVTRESDDTGFGVTLGQGYRVVESGDERGPWKISIADYVYGFHDHAGAEIFSYHWHPAIGPRYPHLHVKATPRTDLRKAHFPTGRIALEQFIRTLIAEFGIRPRRAGWKKILTDTQTTFERYRTWS